MPNSICIENRAGLSAQEFDPFLVALRMQVSIKQALDWLAGHKPPITFSDMTTQDEFSHDIVAEYPGGLHIVYEVT